MQDELLWQIDDGGRVAFASAGLRRAVGEVVGQAFAALFPAADPAWETHFDRARATGAEERFTAAGLVGKGASWEVHVHPAPGGLIATARLASEGEEARHSTEQRLQETLAIVRDPFCVVDRELRFRTVNAAASASAGRSA